MNEPVIKAEHLTKEFKIPHERRDTLKAHFINIFRRSGYETFRAIDNASFEVKRGEFLGITGPNGAGKSTLLKLISGVLRPTSGRITVNGRIAPFLELGVGFEPELSGHDNIFLYGAFLGLSRREIREKYTNIVEFAGLARFMDQKLKNYSSGMQMRLGFSINAHVDADIYLVDEVLAVGDAEFRDRCFAIFEKFKYLGKTIIFVNHDLDMIRRFSPTICVIKGGKMEAIDNIHAAGVKNNYKSLPYETRTRGLG